MNVFLESNNLTDSKRYIYRNGYRSVLFDCNRIETISREDNILSTRHNPYLFIESSDDLISSAHKSKCNISCTMGSQKVVQFYN